jgi:hypothetical protein
VKALILEQRCKPVARDEAQSRPDNFRRRGSTGESPRHAAAVARRADTH